MCRLYGKFASHLRRIPCKMRLIFPRINGPNELIDEFTLHYSLHMLTLTSLHNCMIIDDNWLRILLWSLCRDWEMPNIRDFKIKLRCFLGLDSWMRLCFPSLDNCLNIFKKIFLFIRFSGKGSGKRFLRKMTHNFWRSAWNPIQVLFILKVLSIKVLVNSNF